MKLEYKAFNINNVPEEIDNFVLAKIKLESKLLEEKKIEKRKSLYDFINFTNIRKNILIKNDDEIIPFNFFIVDNNLFLYYCGLSDEQKTNNAIDYIIHILEVTDFNLSKLNKISTEWMMTNEIFYPEYPYFMINNEYYKFGDLKK